MVLCVQAVASWEKTNTLKVQRDFSSFTEWLKSVFLQQKNDDITVTAMVCWILWKNKNGIIWKQHNLEPSEVVKSALSILNQWKSVQDRTFDHFLGYMSHEDGNEHWSLPQSNSVKVNSDAAILEKTSCYSYAFVVRDDKGKLIEARLKCSRGRTSAELAEAIGIHEALSWVKKEEMSNVEIESDYLQIVQAIRRSFLRFSYLGRVIEECRRILANLSNKNVKFKFVKRSANRIAHYLAKIGCSIADRTWRVGDVHPYNDLSG